MKITQLLGIISILVQEIDFSCFWCVFFFFIVWRFFLWLMSLFRISYLRLHDTRKSRIRDCFFTQQSTAGCFVCPTTRIVSMQHCLEALFLMRMSCVAGGHLSASLDCALGNRMDGVLPIN